MRMVDLSHMMNIHTPGWVGYAGNQMYYVQNLQSKAIVAQRIETAMHAGTHIDGAASSAHGATGTCCLSVFASYGSCYSDPYAIAVGLLQQHGNLSIVDVPWCKPNRVARRAT